MAGKDPYFDLIMNEDLAVNKYPESFDSQKKLSKPSLCAQVMTKELFEKYKNHKTKSGWTIARAINTGVKYAESITGCHAGDLESYRDFKDFFKPVIQLYHGYDMDTRKHITNMDASKIKEKISEAALAKIRSTRVRTARNLAGFPLNTSGTKETRLEIAALMEKVFASLEGDLAGRFYRHTDQTPEQMQKLIDEHILFRGRDKMQAASGYHQHWPHGRGVFISHDRHFISWINEGDHVRIISMQEGGDIKSVFERLSRGVKAIEDGLKKIRGMDSVFMNDPALGMITCCPTNLGTALRGSVHILLPKLVSSIGFTKIDEIAYTMHCQARGTSGEHSEVIDTIDVSNLRRLGFTEYELVNDMIVCANKLAEMEDSA